jgi:hypothetical protein
MEHVCVVLPWYMSPDQAPALVTVTVSQGL